jgi:hypothetical protein
MAEITKLGIAMHKNQVNQNIMSNKPKNRLDSG